MIKEGVIDIFFSDAAEEKDILYGIRSAFIGAGFAAGVMRSSDGSTAAVLSEGFTVYETFPSRARVFLCVPFEVSGGFLSTVLSDAKEGKFIREELEKVIAHNDLPENAGSIPFALYIYEKLLPGEIRWWCFEFAEGDVKQMFVLLERVLGAFRMHLHSEYIDRLHKVFFRYHGGEWRVTDMQTSMPEPVAEPLPGILRRAKKKQMREPEARNTEGVEALVAEKEEPLFVSFLHSVFPKGEGIIALVNPVRDARLLFRCARVCIGRRKLPTGFGAFSVVALKWLTIFFVFQTTATIL